MFIMFEFFILLIKFGIFGLFGIYLFVDYIGGIFCVEIFKISFVRCCRKFMVMNFVGECFGG